MASICPKRASTLAADLAPQRGMPGIPSAVSPTSASQSGIDAGGTPNFSHDAGLVEEPLAHPIELDDARPANALRQVLVRRAHEHLLDAGRVGPARRGRRERVVGLEADHRPAHDAERLGGALRERKLRHQLLGHALARLVAGEQLVAERLDHVIERDAPRG